MRVELELSAIELEVVTSYAERQALRDAGMTIVAVLLARLDEAVRNATIRVGDTVSWGPPPYGADRLVVVAVDGDIAWCRSDTGTYHTVLVAEIRKQVIQ